jgi:hypothetical protein
MPLRLALLAAALSGCAVAPSTPGDAAGARDLGPGGCASQDDCDGGTLCEPTAPGSAVGRCSPPSAMHCATCAQDADCGGGAARCFQAPGDGALACHVDCSLSWLACPSDYNCALVRDGAVMRQLCLPMRNVCADVGGGACAAGATQPCMRANAAGTCTGQRTCTGGQFGACDAATPAFLASCGTAAPAGCTVQVAPTALSTASDCGACGNACPGVVAANAEGSCTNPATRTCGMACRGDHYDVDGDPATGCEVTDGDPGAPLQSTPTTFPTTDCNDSTSQNTFSGHLVSDTRAHLDPPVTGFDANVGAAAHWYSVVSTGGFTCTDDYALTFTTTGGPNVSCYVATIITDKLSDRVTLTGAGSGTISGGASSYSDGATIYFSVEKTCSTAAVGGADVAYTVSYHL